MDSGILLRLLNRQADLHSDIRRAVLALKRKGHECVCTLQNLCEFWNVCTRPTSARGGLGLTIEETIRRMRVIERITVVLPDLPGVLERWKVLVAQHHVKGVQAHDTRLVATMDVHGVSHILTLNPKDFHRFSHITAATPDDIPAA